MGLTLQHSLDSDPYELERRPSAADLILVLLLERILHVLLHHRYSVVLKGECLGHTDMRVAVKVYEKPSMTPKKHKMATREAIVLKYLNSQG